MTSRSVRENCPTDFNGTYENTQVVLDCTEIRCQAPSSLLLQSEVFSTYKSHCTFKALIGMSPHCSVISRKKAADTGSLLTHFICLALSLLSIKQMERNCIISRVERLVSCLC